MEIRKVYVGPDNTVLLVCPECGATKSVGVEKFQDRRAPLKIRCKCKSIFGVTFEFRRAYRKDATLVGHYCKLPDCVKWIEMVVKNVALNGIGFATFNLHHLHEGDELAVRFRLDDASRSMIEKNVIVRMAQEKYVGCEFNESVQFDKALGFYLMP